MEPESFVLAILLLITDKMFGVGTVPLHIARLQYKPLTIFDIYLGFTQAMRTANIPHSVHQPNLSAFLVLAKKKLI